MSTQTKNTFIENTYTCTKWICRTLESRYTWEGFNVLRCRECNAPKASGESLQQLPGDWNCSQCQVSNFQRMTVIFNCFSPRNETVGVGLVKRLQRRGADTSVWSQPVRRTSKMKHPQRRSGYEKEVLSPSLSCWIPIHSVMWTVTPN